MTQAERLLPFAGEAPAGVAIKATASLHREGPGTAQLALHYRVTGAQALLLPARSPRPQRRDGLWEHTCLEAFLGPPGDHTYWELNLSPSGDWNVYRLEAYRRGLQSEPFFTALPFTCRMEEAAQPSSLILELNTPLPPELAAAPELAVGLNAVLESLNGAISYWALRHPRAEADFHDRGGWTLKL